MIYLICELANDNVAVFAHLFCLEYSENMSTGQREAVLHVRLQTDLVTRWCCS